MFVHVSKNSIKSLHRCTFSEFLGALGEEVLSEQIERMEVPRSLYSYVMLLPLEVKTGDNSKLQSLHQYMEESKECIALRLWNGPLSSDEIRLPSGKLYTLYNLPFYYAGQMELFLTRKFTV